MNQNWLYVNNGAVLPAKNMLIDTFLLDYAADNAVAAVLRIYSWSKPAVSIGCNQSASSVKAISAFNDNIEIIRRPTGGRAIFHQNDLTYSFVIKKNLLKTPDNVINTYIQISQPLVDFFSALGLLGVDFGSSGRVYARSSACMAVSTGADLEYKGKKIAGSAQLRKNDYILQHGSILLEQDFKMAAEILGVKESELSCINLFDAVGQRYDYDSMSLQLKKSFEVTFGVTFTDFDISSKLYS